MSYCDCDDDGDPPDFMSVRHVKHARKETKCYECSGPIRKGEPYKKVVGSWCGGGIDTYTMCHLCLELEQWAKISVPCFCWNVFGSLHDTVREMVADISHTTPGFFMEYGRRIVAIRRRKNKPAEHEGNDVGQKSSEISNADAGRGA